MKKIVYALLLLSASALLASCGGGGSSGGDPTAPATVGIVITDAGIEDWDEALATITSVSLIGEGGHQNLFTGTRTVDLLSLREHLKVFMIKNAVKPGNYSKVRLEVADLMLVKRDPDGSVASKQAVKVPSGKVDLNAQGTFFIAPGSIVFLSLDWDMEKSLKFTQTGAGNWTMRPVIFVNIGTKPGFKDGLARMSGTVQSVADDQSEFRLCSAPTAPTPSPLSSGDDDEPWCVDVLLDARTGIFGDGGVPKPVKEVSVGEAVTVVGQIRRAVDDASSSSSASSSDAGDDECDFQVLAIVVESGASGTWTRLRGTLASIVGGDQRFDFDPDAGQGYDDAAVLKAQLFPESRIFHFDSTGVLSEIAATDLQVSDRAALDAVKLTPAAPGGTELNVAVMLTRPPVAALESVSGTISTVDLGSDKVWLNDGTACIAADANTQVYLLADTGSVLDASLADLEAGVPATATGQTYDLDGCLEAKIIVSVTTSGI